MTTRSLMKAALTTAAAATLLLVAAPTAHAVPWSFGVISDTQQTVAGGQNTAATSIIAAVNQQFVNRNVDLVLAVGDLCDDGSTAGEQSRYDANTLLNNAGIPFYAIRGNHDDTAAGQSFFLSHYLPASTATATVNVAPDGMDYAVTYKNTTFVMLDILTADSTAGMDGATTWMNTALSTDGHQQAFVIQHKNLLGQNHKDNAFGSSNDANPTEQNNFFAALQNNGVRYDISGHDHMDHRSIVTSPDGQHQVQEIITQSDSTKFYTGAAPWSAREQTVSDQQNKIGYYIFTVDGPRVTGQYYATTPVNSDIAANPIWTLQDTFGYSTNGKQVIVARGASYAGISDAITPGAGFKGTSMQILGGTNTVTATAEGSRAEVDGLNIGWVTGADSHLANAASDVLYLWGMNNGLGSEQTDPFVLSMNFDPNATNGDFASGNTFMVSQDGNGNWVNTVNMNFGGTPNFVVGAYNDSYGLGTYGIDPTTDTAWAVVNHNSTFAVPEPASLGLLALGSLLLFRRNRKA